MRTTRRGWMGTALAGLAAGRAAWAAQEAGAGGVPVRPFGKTGVKLPVIALGGWDIGTVRDDAEAIGIMQEAVAGGLTFFDNCWEYHGGRSEELMGRALEGGRRDKVFLMTKVCGRTKADALKHLDESLRRLRTDRLDLWQFHGIKWDDDADLIFDERNGAALAAIEARKAGKIRFIGFTGHKAPAFHLGMLRRNEGGRPFEWNSVQMPLNLIDPQYASFQKEVLPVCSARGIPVLAMKSLGAQKGRIPRELKLGADLCRRYTLSLPICSMICGIASREDLRQDLRIAREFKPVTPEELADIARRTEGVNRDGKIEAYKTGDYGCNIHHVAAK